MNNINEELIDRLNKAQDLIAKQVLTWDEVLILNELDNDIHNTKNRATGCGSCLRSIQSRLRNRSISVNNTKKI